MCFFLAAELGFEPRHTESESAVLPLHNSAILSLVCVYRCRDSIQSLPLGESSVRTALTVLSKTLISSPGNIPQAVCRVPCATFTQFRYVVKTMTILAHKNTFVKRFFVFLLKSFSEKALVRCFVKVFLICNAPLTELVTGVKGLCLGAENSFSSAKTQKRRLLKIPTVCIPIKIVIFSHIYLLSLEKPNFLIDILHKNATGCLCILRKKQFIIFTLDFFIIL